MEAMCKYLSHFPWLVLALGASLFDFSDLVGLMGKDSRQKLEGRVHQEGASIVFYSSEMKSFQQAS